MDTIQKTEYPIRQKYWAMRYIRIMTKVCTAQDVGTSGFTLLAIIVTTEDAAGYRRPVTYYDGQLAPLVGLESQKSLAIARRRCVEAGWLEYRPGSKGRASQYWTIVPEHAMGLDDYPTDEGRNDARQIPRKNDDESGINREQKRREATGQRSNYLPITEDPDSGAEEEDLKSSCKKQSENEINLVIDALVSKWNQCDGFAKIRTFTKKRRSALRARLSESEFSENWSVALARIRGVPFMCGVNDRGWTAHIDWFLEADSVTKILEGKYDSRNGHKVTPQTSLTNDPRGAQQAATAFLELYGGER